MCGAQQTLHSLSSGREVKCHAVITCHAKSYLRNVSIFPITVNYLLAPSQLIFPFLLATLLGARNLLSPLSLSSPFVQHRIAPNERRFIKANKISLIMLHKQYEPDYMKRAAPIKRADSGNSAGPLLSKQYLGY